jgi:excinuclease ABC subunit C
MFEKLKIRVEKLPPRPGVYLFKDRGGKTIYVGKSVNLKSRVKSYLQPENQLGPKTTSMVKEIRKIDYISVDSEIEALLLEASLIKKYQPKYNVIWKDDKSPLYIKITVGDKIPIITTARREGETRGILLFGPFPRSSVAREVLKTLRRIFPYCQHKKTQKSCLWIHLGLCPDPYRGDLKGYRKNIKNIVMILRGQSKKVIRKLEKEMKILSKHEVFENAAKIKKQIENIQYLTQTYHGPEEYLEKPNLYQDLIEQRLRDLARVVKLKKIPRRIEAIDISNMMGKEASGSLIVFQDGERDRSQYRRFKIKNKKTPDDVAMIKEVLSRRLKNKWPLPDLFVIDGGLGQLNAALTILGVFGLKIPTITLAKREEEIYVPSSKKTLQLKKDSLALQLIQEIRDEAHRFALSYHRKLREKAFLTKKWSL